MGRVFLGMSPGGRKVAIKVINPECADSPQFRERFAREIDAARRVGGFHAAQVVDADPGADPPWMVTAYIEGPTLAQEIAQRGPMPASRVRELGAQLAEGLAAIHAAGLVHRDLKPGNVILAPDGPRIIDFGIARPTQAAAGLTTTGMVIGTIAFMSPEQARGETVGQASDVFSLGAVLAFAATGRTPFGVQPTSLSAIDDERLQDVITACLVDSAALRPAIAGILAALAPEGSIPAADSVPLAGGALLAGSAAASEGVPAAPGAPTVDGPANGGPSAPAPPGPAPAGLLQPGPHPQPGPLAQPQSAARPGSHPQPASLPHPRPLTQRGPLPGSVAHTARNGSRPPSRRAVLFAGLGTAAVAAVGVPVGLELASSGNGTSGAAGSQTTTRPGTTPTAGSGTPASAAGTQNGQPGALDKRSILQHGLHGGAQAIMFSPNGHVLASGNGDGTTTVWNVDTQVSISTLGRGAAASAGSAGQSIDGVAFSPDGAMLATASGDGKITLWDMASSKKITTLPGSTSAQSSGLASSVAFSPSGSILAISHDAATVTLWDVASRTAVATLHGTAGQWVYSLAFSPDGQLLATGSGHAPGATTSTPGTVQVWQVATRKVLTTVAHTNTGPGALAFSGQKLANVNADGTVSVRNLVTQSKATVLTNVSSNAKSVAFRSDGKELMTGNGDGTGTLFDTTTREVTRTLDTGTKAEVPSVAYRRGAPGLACAGENLVLWT